MSGQERLRGKPDGIVASTPDAARVKTYGKRVDGTLKGPGFFGELARIDDPEIFSGELSTSITVNGQKMLFPLLVPGLTAEEIAHLVDGGNPTHTIVEKAYRHARQRIGAGKSPFADFGEQTSLPTSAEHQLAEGYHDTGAE